MTQLRLYAVRACLGALALTSCTAIPSAKQLGEMSEHQLWDEHRRVWWNSASSSAYANVSGIRDEILRRHPEWGADASADIRSRKVWVGATRQQVILAVGQPDRDNASGGVYGQHNQLVFSWGRRDPIYFYFDNDKLTSWQMTCR